MNHNATLSKFFLTFTHLPTHPFTHTYTCVHVLCSSCRKILDCKRQFCYLVKCPSIPTQQTHLGQDSFLTRSFPLYLKKKKTTLCCCWRNRRKSGIKLLPTVRRLINEDAEECTLSCMWYRSKGLAGHRQAQRRVSVFFLAIIRLLISKEGKLVSISPILLMTKI